MTVERKLKVRDVEPQWANPDLTFDKESDYDRLEPTVRTACKKLHDKGIRTYWSSGDKFDLSAMIIIEKQNLNSRNLSIARAHFNFDDDHARVGLEVPMTPDDLASKIDDRLCELADLFESQIDLTHR